jgi:hypothetical protein
MNHQKIDCNHKDKDCANCGKNGHMAVVCRSMPQQLTQSTQRQPKGPAHSQTGEKPDYATVVKSNCEVPWRCTDCMQPVYGQKLSKCPRGGCNGKRLMPERIPTTVADKSFIKVQFLQDSEPTGVAAGDEQEEDAEMNDDTQLEQEHLQKSISYNQAKGWCTKQLTERLQEITPKLLSRIDMAKAGRDYNGEQIRLLKQQETSSTNLKAKIASNVAKNKEIVEQQAAAIATEMERHLKTIEAAHDDFGRMIEANLKESAEAEAKLQALKERYEADYKTLDAKMAASVTAEPLGEQPPAETRAAPPRLPLAPSMPSFTVDSLAHMQATGVISPEQLALVPQMLALFNAMLAAQAAQPATPHAGSATTPNADGKGAEAQAQDAQEKEKERLEAVELAQLNGGGAQPNYSAGKPPKHSDRNDPLG